MKNISDIFEKIKGSEKACVSIAAAEDQNVLEAVKEADSMGLANFILVGSEEKIASIANDIGLDISRFEIIDEPDSVQACKTAVKQVVDGRASAVMKGFIDTSVIMRAALDRDHGMRTGKKLSHLAVFEMPAYHKLLMLTDAAVNIAPDLETKKVIIQNAIDCVHHLGIDNPKVALLAAKEKVDEKMPVTVDCDELVKAAQKGEITGGILDGPIALDIAVSKEAAVHKGYKGEAGGDADILFVPDIEAGNVLYKSFNMLASAKCGGVVVGAKAPIILTSRSDSSESKLISIAIGILFGGGVK